MKKVTLVGNAGKLHYFIKTHHLNLKNKNSSKSRVIVPNGYGVLKYIHSLSDELMDFSDKIYIPVLRGQNDSGGELNVEGAREDLKLIIEDIINKDKSKISLVCHCSSLLYLADISPKKTFGGN